jgi:uncharacterized protein
MKLVFDPQKDALNVSKHGISLDQANLVFNNPNKITLESDRQGENRLMDIAIVELNGVVLVLVYVLREESIRPISLRRASKRERSLYANYI